MNVLSLFSFVAALVYAGLGIYALQPRPRTPAAWSFVGLCAAMSFWALTFTFAYPAATVEQYVFLTRASALGSATSPAIFLHFALVLTAPRRRLPAWILLALYVPVTVTIAAEWLYPFREGVDFVRGWAGWTRTFVGIRPLFVLQRLIHGGLFIAGLLLIHRWGTRSPVPRERLQARVIVRTGAATVAISLTLDTVLPLCGWRPLPTTVPIVGTLWASGIAYAMLRHRFMILDPALAGGILHDFNNLLTAVEGHIDLVRRAPATPLEAVRSLEEAGRAAHRARRLAHRFMAYVTGQPPPRERVRIGDLLAEAVLLVADRPGYRCEMDLAPDLGWLEADEAQLLQALGNLLVNAREAMPNGGVISIHADTCVVGADRRYGEGLPPPGRHVRIRIADVGVGISAELLPRVFEPFVSTKRRGTGLGLAMVRRVTRDHGGAVSVRSTPGQGAEFTLWLPMPEGAPDVQAATAPASTPHRILVMEDDPLVAAVTADMLSALGHRPLVCHDGDDAIARFAEAAARGDPFDLVMVDFTIRYGPGGPATLARLRELDTGTRVVLMSGSRENLEVARATAMGFAGFLLKPFSLEDLSGVVSGAGTPGGGPPPSAETAAAP